MRNSFMTYNTKEINSKTDTLINQKYFSFDRENWQKNPMGVLPKDKGIENIKYEHVRLD